MNCVHGLQVNIVKMLKCFSTKKSADLMYYQKSKDFQRNRKNNFTVHMEPQRAINSQANPRKKKF